MSRQRSRTVGRRRPIALRLDPLEPRVAPSLTPVLLKDVNATTRPAVPTARYVPNWAAVGSTLFFTADASPALGGTLQPELNTELWKTDGTAAGTQQVIDLCPGVYGSEPGQLTAANGKLFFTADDGTGYDLWATDGTAAGTVRLTANHSDLLGAPGDLTAVGGTLFFSNYASGGWELWKSDGTPAGTARVADIYPGPNGSLGGGQNYFCNVNGTLFFAADDGTHGRELWKSDGTAAGTVLVKDINPGSTASYPEYLVNVNGTLFFAANDGTHGEELWTSDGTPAGTKMVEDIVAGSSSSYPKELTEVGPTLFFRCQTDQVWKSDGTPAGTGPVVTGSSPTDLRNVNGTLFFTRNGDELWKSDGTAGGTVLVKSFYVGPSTPTSVANLTALGSTVYFAADDGSVGAELWKSDGTAAGTVRVADVRPGAAGSAPDTLTPFGGKLYFSADDGTHGRELWASDGTAAGTGLVKDANTNTMPSNSTAHGFTPVNGTTVFFADDGVHGEELWRTDGTAAGTALVKDIRPGPASAISAFYGLPVAFNGAVYFTADDGTHFGQLWRTDGTTAGTVMVTTGLLHPPRYMAAVDGALYFQAADSGSGEELWRSDGTPAGTVLVKDILPGGSGSYPKDFVGADGRVFFQADDGTHGYELWETDGTTAGTALVKDINPGANDSEPGNPTPFAGRLFFTADDGAHGRELWTTDGTAGGTTLFADINPGTAAAFDRPNIDHNNRPALLTPAGPILFFAANDGVHGAELWKTDGTPAGTAMVKDIEPTNFGSMETWDVRGVLGVLNGTAFFSADDGPHGWELWKSDGTTAGTVLVKDIQSPDLNPIYPGSRPILITPMGNELFFSADGGPTGRELWRTDGTTAHTVLVADLEPNPYIGSFPGLPTPVGNTLYFSADDGAHGYEPWTLAVAAPTATVAPVSPDPRNTPVSGLAIAFSEAVTGFDLSDLSLALAGTPVSLAGATLTTTDNVHWALGNLAGLTGADGAYTLTVRSANTFIEDADALPLAADATATWVMDTTPPTVAGIAAVSPDPRNTPVDSVDVTFSEPIDGSTFTAGNLSLTRDGTAVSLNGVTIAPVAGSIYRVSGLAGATSAAGSYQLTVTAAGILDPAGNAGSGSASTSWVTDTTPPTVAGIAPVSPDPRRTPVDSIDVTFSEPIAAATLDGSDLALTRDGTPVALAGLTVTPVSAAEYLVGGLSPFTAAQGAYALTVAAAGVTDLAGNAGVGTGSVGWTADTTPPAVTVTQAAGQADPTNGPVSFDVAFSEPVLGFDATKIDLSASTAAGPLSATVTPHGPAGYTVVVTGMTGSGTVVAAIDPGVVADQAGNGNLGSTGGDNTVTFDNVAPTVTIAPAAGQPEPAVVAPVVFDVAFSEPVVGFDGSKVDLTGTTAPGAVATATDRGDHTHFTVAVSGMSAGGTIEAAVRAGVVTDLAGNPNQASGPGGPVNFIDVGVVAFASATYQIARAGGPVLSVVVRRVGGSEGPLSADYATIDGSAVAGTDYTAASGTLTWAAGDATDRTIAIPIRDPGGPGPDGAFGVELGNVSPAGVLGSPATTAVTLLGSAELSFDAASVPAAEGDTAVVTVHRRANFRGAVSVNYATADGTATAPADYAAASGTLDWADGDTADKTFTVPVVADGLNEGRETIGLVLSSPTAGAVVGVGAAAITIAPSDGFTLVGLAGAPRSTFADADGDRITVALGGKAGTLTYYLTNGRGPIAEIDLAGTDPARSTVTVAVQKPKGRTGDGRVGIGEVDGSGFKTFTARAGDLDGAGFHLTGFAGSIAVGDVSNGADFLLSGAAPAPGAAVRIAAGVIGSGTDLIVAAPVRSITATAIGAGTIAAPSVGTIRVTGRKAVAGRPAVAGDFAANLTISGAGVDPIKGKALGSLTVTGTVSHAVISVGGNVGTVTVGAFNTSDLFVGYAGPADGSGSFGGDPFYVQSFTTRAAAHSFVNSDVIATKFGTVSLASVDTANGGTKFGFDFRATTRAGKPFGGVGRLFVKAPSTAYDTILGGTQVLAGDLEVKEL